MIRAPLMPLLLIALADAGAPSAPAHPHVYTREGAAMGTIITFTAWTTDDNRAAKAFQQAFEDIQHIELMMTDWDRPGVPKSDVVRINEAAGKQPVQVSAETLEVIETAQDMSQRSGGAFDITFAAMRGLWKFDEDLDKKVPPAEEIRKRKKLINYRDVVVDHKAQTVYLRRPGMRLGLGGIAKGYAVDRAVAVLRKAGLNDFIVKAGGDLFAAGSKGDTPWRVGIADPRGARGEYFATAPIKDHAFSTAGDYERSFVLGGKRYHHIIDPKTGFPATASRSVTIYAPTALAADALDDAVFILGPERGMKLVDSLPGTAAVIVDAHNKVFISPALQSIVKHHSPTDGV